MDSYSEHQNSVCSGESSDQCNKPRKRFSVANLANVSLVHRDNNYIELWDKADLVGRVRLWKRLFDQARKELWFKATPIEREAIFRSVNAQERWFILLDAAGNKDERRFWATLNDKAIDALAQAQSYTLDQLASTIGKHLTSDEQDEWHWVYPETKMPRRLRVTLIKLVLQIITIMYIFLTKIKRFFQQTPQRKKGSEVSPNTSQRKKLMKGFEVSKPAKLLSSTSAFTVKESNSAVLLLNDDEYLQL